ncbi:MAG: DUF433 domain-containing protein [Deltaproteobacteria bacterium]|nr:DUF433 domain-containing protein [Deltaproteobacteria bacterium]
MPELEEHRIDPQGIATTLTSSGSAPFVPHNTPGGATVIREPKYLRVPEPSFDRIITEPNICMGEPTIRGTRITAAFVYRLVKSGMQVREVLQAYPQLDEDSVRQALEFIDRRHSASPPIYIVIR